MKVNSDRAKKITFRRSGLKSELLNEALVIEKRFKGNTHIDVAKTLSALSYKEYSIQYSGKKKYQEAIQQAEEAMAIVKKHSGPDNILIVEPKRTVALCTQDMARKESGEEKFLNV